jgi:hypothetical protein
MVPGEGHGGVTCLVGRGGIHLRFCLMTASARRMDNSKASVTGSSWPKPEARPPPGPAARPDFGTRPNCALRQFLCE